MTAPGNSVVLLILLGSFVASTGYAAGRLHQWYRMDQERDEAYRVGYDMATRNVFSLAARVIGPRRERAAARGSASVHRSSVSSGSSSRSASPPSSSSVLPASVLPLSVLPDPLVPGPLVSGPVVPDSVVPGPLVSGPLVSGPLVSGPVVPDSVVSDSVVSGSVSSPAVSSSVPSDLSPSFMAGAPSPSPSGGGPAGIARSSRSASGDERLVTGDSDRYQEAAASRGRHTVPDELVQAATYRLTPDRVARAKVRQKPAVDLPDDETSRLPEFPNGVPVPKPRSS